MTPHQAARTKNSERRRRSACGGRGAVRDANCARSDRALWRKNTASAELHQCPERNRWGESSHRFRARDA
eukprot:8639354-Alexandrium_andersonii.AAC.1